MATNVRSYEPGLSVSLWGQNNSPPTASSTDYFVTDHLGTTRGLTNSSAAPIEAATYSAFGEKISGTNHRFGYVGEFGYQAHAEMPYLHLGHRYYDPSTGRFLQRDPIGISGGPNVYAYVSARPTAFVDPTGLGCQAVGPYPAYFPPPPSPPPAPGSDGLDVKVKVNIKGGTGGGSIEGSIEISGSTDEWAGAFNGAFCWAANNIYFPIISWWLTPPPPPTPPSPPPIIGGPPWIVPNNSKDPA